MWREATAARQWPCAVRRRWGYRASLDTVEATAPFPDGGQLSPTERSVADEEAFCLRTARSMMVAVIRRASAAPPHRPGATQ